MKLYRSIATVCLFVLFAYGAIVENKHKLAFIGKQQALLRLQEDNRLRLALIPKGQKVVPQRELFSLLKQTLTLAPDSLVDGQTFVSCTYNEVKYEALLSQLMQLTTAYSLTIQTFTINRLAPNTVSAYIELSTI
jgi:hypothetical protein